VSTRVLALMQLSKLRVTVKTVIVYLCMIQGSLEADLDVGSIVRVSSGADDDESLAKVAQQQGADVQLCLHSQPPWAPEKTIEAGT
jgi:hypothetical protein